MRLNEVATLPIARADAEACRTEIRFLAFMHHRSIFFSAIPNSRGPVIQGRPPDSRLAVRP